MKNINSPHHTLPTTNLTLTQLIDLKAIVPLLDNLSHLCNVSCDLIDLNGDVLIRSRMEGICEQFYQRHPVSLANCLENKEKVMDVDFEKGYQEFPCQNGLTDVVIPIDIHGNRLGAFFLGPFFKTKNEAVISSFRQKMTELGFNEVSYVKALNSIPSLADEHTTFLISSFSGLTNLIKSIALRDLAIANEIEERIKQEDEIREVKKKAEEADKLKTAFLANLSHEIRTPMNSILGFSELMTRENLNEEERLAFIAIIKESGEALLELIDDIIDLSRIATNQIIIRKLEFDAIDLLKEVYQIFREQAVNTQKSHIKFLLDSGFAEPVILYSDRLRVKQILSCLLRNAFKFSDKGSILIGCTKQADELVFYVKDSGIGIPGDQHDQIFEHFRQGENNLSRKFGGAGLGLAIAKDLSSLLGCKLWLESEVDYGSVFYFSIKYESKNI